MRKFYEKVLPSQGVYCVTGINKDGITKNKFAESLDDFLTLIETFKQSKQNVFFNPASLKSYSRKNDNVLHIKSFYVDLDVGTGKEYASKDEALAGLTAFIESQNMPTPVIVDSGRGIHAYWIFDREVTVDEWKPYAEKFKALCIANGLHIDPVVTAHEARILRCPDTFNYKEDPPLPTRLIGEGMTILNLDNDSHNGEVEIYTYSFDDIKEFLGNDDEVVSSGQPKEDFSSILNNIPKGMDEDSRAVSGADNFATKFETLVLRSLDDKGCEFIKQMVMADPNTVGYNDWTAVLSIANKCDDREVAIHTFSEGCTTYDHDETIKKAESWGGPRTCIKIRADRPTICDGCSIKDGVKKNAKQSPIYFAKELKYAREPEQPRLPVIADDQLPDIPSEDIQGAVRTTPSADPLPASLHPYVRTEDGGIYNVPAPVMDKSGKVIQPDPTKITSYNLYAMKRVFSTIDGECLLMRYELPNDEPKEFLLPMRHIYATEKFKEVMSSNGVLFNATNGVAHLMNYVIKWGEHLILKGSAEIMRDQMGWVDNNDGFVVGNREYRRDGTVRNVPTSPLAKNVTQFLRQEGSFEKWQWSANQLAREGFELHAFVLLLGFAAPLMSYTSTSGAAFNLLGESGNAKSGAMLGQMSIWGKPKEMWIHGPQNTTANGAVSRMVTLHNLPFGFDEIGSIAVDQFRNLVHGISTGAAKIRNQGSLNAERDYQKAASTIMTSTSNHSMSDLLSSDVKAAKGEMARFIEFIVPRPTVLLTNPELGELIFDAFNHNCGWAGPMFIQHIYKQPPDYISSKIEKWKAIFDVQFGKDITYRFYKGLIVCVFVAGEIANEAGILNYPLSRIFSVSIDCLSNHRDDTASAHHVDYEAVVGDFISKNINNTLVIHNGQAVSEPRGSLIIRADVDTSTLYLSSSEFNTYLANLKLSRREFIRDMALAGAKVEYKKQRMTANWKSAVSVININTYAIDTTSMAKDIFKHETAGT